MTFIQLTDDVIVKREHIVAIAEYDMNKCRVTMVNGNWFEIPGDLKSLCMKIFDYKNDVQEAVTKQQLRDRAKAKKLVNEGAQ